MSKNLLSVNLFTEAIVDPKEIKHNIVEHHQEYNPFIWKILLETVGLVSKNLEKDDFYNDIEYKLLYQYSFVEYLASYSLRMQSPNTNKEILIPYFSGIIVEKIERDKQNIDQNKDLNEENPLFFDCLGSCESLYNNVLKESSEEIKYVNEVLKNVLKDENIDKTRVKLIYRYPLKISSKILHQIHIDIKRLSIDSKKVGDKDISYMYYNILVLVSHRRPALGYIQGMADILVPFIVEYANQDIQTAESSAYFCYLKLIDKIQDNITGLQGDLLFLLQSKLEQIDPDMFSFLKHSKLEIHMFAFRWFNCLYIREFPYALYRHILTTMLCYEDPNDFLVYFGVSLLLHFKNQLYLHDFSDNIIILQNINTYEWTENIIIELLNTTSVYFKTFGKIK
ncbi:TBC1 domain family member 22A [Nosema granulosis]|uniref:TBC1 domain family member 22A n=1 Tax=Nosema granulosis TaxID=83296 RepID=A0A9P6L093_9MICR|nr:TBC1 domain family member 22A [Nosema granulosis]